MPDLTPVAERELAALDAALEGRPVPADLAELGALAVALRDERPEIVPGFAAELDRRAARGFAGDAPPRRARTRARHRWNATRFAAPAFATVAAGLLVVAVLAVPRGADDGGGGGGTAASSGEAASEAAPDADASRALSGDSTVAPAPVPVPPGGGGSPGSDGRGNRKVERSAALTLATRPGEIDAVSARVQDVVRRQRGFVASSDVASTGAGGGGTFELRIPARNLDAAMAALARLGSVRERADRSQDITSISVSARDRLGDARAERAGLLRRLARAETDAEVAALRARLRDASAEIATTRRGVARIANRAAYANVLLTLVADSDTGAGVPGEDRWSPGDAARDALRVLELAAGVVLVAAAVALPLALLAVPLAVVTRRGARRRRERALDAG